MKSIQIKSHICVANLHRIKHASGVYPTTLVFTHSFMETPLHPTPPPKLYLQPTDQTLSTYLPQTKPHIKIKAIMSYPHGLRPPPSNQNVPLSSLSLSNTPSPSPSPQPSTSAQATTTTTTISSGLRYPSNRKTIYDRNLNRSKTAELSRASFAYLFGEMITYAQRKVSGIQDLEKRYVPSKI